MTLGYHSISQVQLRALASGRGGAGAVPELIAAQYSKHLLLLRGVVKAASGGGDDQLDRARRAYDLLGAAHQRDPAATEAIIGHPAVGAWGSRTLRAAYDGKTTPGAEPAHLSGVAAAAAVSAGLRAEIAVPAMSGTVVLPSLGNAIVDDTEGVVRTGPDSTEIISSASTVQVPPDLHRDAPSWRGLRRLRAGALNVLIDDADPFRLPASANVAPRLSSTEIGHWQTNFSSAWRILEADHPADALEAAAVISVVVPLNAPEQGIASSSSAEAFGTIAMSRPPDPQICAATIIHELQHLKLSAIIDIVRLTYPDSGNRFYAAWRDDPRPASGLLQGAYAHLGLLRFWRTQRRVLRGSARLTAERELARWLPATAQAIDVLRSSQCLTPEGQFFATEMQASLRSMRDEPISAEARALAHEDETRHLRQWKLRNGPLPA